ncbi:MAG TPA: DNA mismatch repair endonuclease MutL [Ktedonobacteraceae bacterium]|jgi:DNA mismatch repair protein MutL|nr:DNA mismatch repair endonuclease MutL [Ktedonobacteraceae bacterium]
MPIRQLAPDVAAKIAAGEVVERPASVVKELIENSIDAGATQIRVDLVHGGLQLIRVTDNGSGIPPEELPLALERHATSKVAQIDDLERIRSLGFRGEALASIAAVAEVNLLSHARGAEQGAEISASNGQISAVSPAASPEGTALVVRNLFSAVPARLKFLKSRNTEVSHCHHLLEQYALAYPEIRFSVFSEGRQIFATPGDGQLASVLVEVYGLQIAEQMVSLQSGESSRGDNEGRPVVSGYVSRPVSYKSTRQYISFFVNRRWVLSRMLTSAVEGAYHSLLLPGRHPIAVVNIQVDPGLLDVNVHPAKTEIRFLKERPIFAAILRAVRAALLEEPQMPQWQSRRSTTASQVEEQGAEMAPERASTVSPIVQEAEEDDPLAGLDELDDTGSDDRPFTISSPTTGPEKETTYPHDNPWLTVTEEETGTRPPVMARLWQSHVRNQVANRADYAATPRIESSPAAPLAAQVEQAALSQPSGQGEEKLEDRLSQEAHAEEVKREASASEEVWAGTRVDPTQPRKLPRLRVVGQVAQSFIVTEGEDGMFLVDQHAAHERILLERMVAALKARTPLSQLLLTPIPLDLAPTELEALEEHRPQLEQIGFAFASATTHMLEIQAVPSVLVKQMNARSLHELLVDLTAPESLGHTETWEERALANVACKAAIKANYFLTVSEMREMLEQLEQTRAPFSCCHGRPTMVHFSLSALEREFGRR